MSFSPDGSQLAYTRMASAKASREDIYRAPATGGRSVRFTHDARSMRPVWGPSWIVFIRQSAPSPRDHIPKQSLYLVKPSGVGLHRLTNVTIGDRMFGSRRSPGPPMGTG
jgi:Tol biopolymer transport system component